jgi:hypothetical protein
MHTHSPVHSSIGTPSAWLAPTASDCSRVRGFRISFTPHAGVLFTVHSRYSPLSVVAGTSPWGVVPPASGGLPRQPPYSRAIPPAAEPAPTGLSPAPGALSSRLRLALGRTSGTAAAVPRMVAQPPARVARRPRARAGFRHVPVRSPLLGESFLFLGVLRCFSYPGYLQPPYILRWR